MLKKTKFRFAVDELPMMKKKNLVSSSSSASNNQCSLATQAKTDDSFDLERTEYQNIEK